MARPNSRDPATNLPAALRAIGRRLAFTKDCCVFRKGDPVRAVFLVLEGEVRLSRFGKDGSEIALHRAGHGEFFAEAALNAARYRCDAIASRATTLLAFPADKVRALLAKDQEFTREWVALLARQLHASRARLERLALKSAAERVLHYLHTEGKGSHSEVMLTGSVKDLARELGLTHESLYRTLARLQKDGIIAREKERLLLR
jgi:CRP/FNR family transcriptional regulator, dissimilatory nitrate respiration regulator